MIEVALSDGRVTKCEAGTRLSDALFEVGIVTNTACGGHGICGKCKVTIEGEGEVLACTYKLSHNITVHTHEQLGEVFTGGKFNDGKQFDSALIAADIGSTTIALALIDTAETVVTAGTDTTSETTITTTDKTNATTSDTDTTNKLPNDTPISTYAKAVSEVVTFDNPQKKFGGDVIARISYASVHGNEKMKNAIVGALDWEINALKDRHGVKHIDRVFVSGNMTMLHILLDEDCVSMGQSPFAPKFLDTQVKKSIDLGFSVDSTIETLPGISAFVGADIVAGMIASPVPRGEKYNILVDLGTNAEIALFDTNGALVTAAAAGPCFEGGNISCGMSAKAGAINSFELLNGTAKFTTIGNAVPKGICGTALIDIVAELLKHGIIDENGTFSEESDALTADENGTFAEDDTVAENGTMGKTELFTVDGDFKVADGFFITQRDIREFQLAKSAIRAAVETLLAVKNITSSDIDKLIVSGGFSAQINLKNAVFCGLLPKWAAEKFSAGKNSSLLGTIRVATDKTDLGNPQNLDAFLKNSEYCDISTNPVFADLFVEYMGF